MKKKFTLLLALIMVITMMPVKSSAEEAVQETTAPAEIVTEASMPTTQETVAAEEATATEETAAETEAAETEETEAAETEETVAETEAAETEETIPEEEVDADSNAETAKAQGIALNEQNFPDTNFMVWLMNNVDADYDEILTPQELAVTTMDLSGSEAVDLTGIEHFTQVRKLVLNPEVNYVDLSTMPYLEDLSVLNAANLAVLDLSNMTSLRRVRAYSYLRKGSLSSMILTGCSKLEELQCWGNQLTYLDLEGCSSLKWLDCNNNALTSLDLSSSNAILEVLCNHNEITDLDVSGKKALNKLDCSQNRLEHLNVTGCSKLESLSAENNLLPTLDVSTCPNITMLLVNSNSLTSLDLHALTRLGTGDASDQHYPISGRSGNFANLPGNFDVSRIKAVKCGTHDNNTFTTERLPYGMYAFCYEYDTGASEVLEVTLVSQTAETLTPGWKQDRNGWMYIREDLVIAKGFAEIEGKWYCFDNNGYMITGWKQVDGNWYYFAGSGVMTVGWKQFGSWWYHFQSSGIMDTGWQKIYGKYYCFADNGVMYTNQWIGNSYVGADGAWIQGMFKPGWTKDSKGWKYVHEDHSFTRNDFEKIGSRTHYFDANGYMVTGWQEVNGKTYYFDGNGYMATYWKTVEGKSYFFYADGSMARNTWIGNYYVDANGVWDANAVKAGWNKTAQGWKYIHDDGSFTTNDFEKIGGHTHYFDANGYMVMGWQEVNGKTYYFDGNGYMAIYWQTVEGKSYFFYTDGSMARNTWIGNYYVDANGAWNPNAVKPHWKQFGKKWRYIHSDGSFTKNDFENIKGNTFYFDAKGNMATGWKTLNGNRYHFGADGIMAKGWRHIGAKDYFFGADGVMAVNTWIGDYYVGADGAWVSTAKK